MSPIVVNQNATMGPSQMTCRLGTSNRRPQPSPLNGDANHRRQFKAHQKPRDGNEHPVQRPPEEKQDNAQQQADKRHFWRALGKAKLRAAKDLPTSAQVMP